MDINLLNDFNIAVGDNLFFDLSSSIIIYYNYRKHKLSHIYRSSKNLYIIFLYRISDKCLVSINSNVPNLLFRQELKGLAKILYGK